MGRKPSGAANAGASFGETSTSSCDLPPAHARRRATPAVVLLLVGVVVAVALPIVGNATFLSPGPWREILTGSVEPVHSGDTVVQFVSPRNLRLLPAGAMGPIVGSRSGAL